MNELIKIQERNGEQLVSARELHQFLEVKTRYNDWFLRMCEYGFIENVDYIVVTQKRVSSEIKGYTEYTDHLMKISMAKEISMIQRNGKGKQAREYFIKCEEAWNSPQMILARANQIQSRMLENYKEKVIVLEQKIEEDKPKVLFANAVETSETSILIGELAKIITQNGYKIGQNSLFAWLRNNGYLIKRRGSDWNMPTQRAMELGLFEIRERTVNNPDGSVKITKTPKVTGKGQVYFTNKFLKVA